MACRTSRFEDGATIWMCGKALKNVGVCSVCGDAADILCDYPVGNGKTCDRKMCERCAIKIHDDLHYCKCHHEEYKLFKPALKILQLVKGLENGNTETD